MVEPMLMGRQDEEMSEKQYEMIILSGPTGVGKTQLCEILAKKWGAEIISADSQAVYKGMDIGTAKPIESPVPYHCLDIVSPREQFDVGAFVCCADKAVRDIKKRGKNVIVSGGTPMYIHRFLYGLSPLPGRDRELRKTLSSLMEKKGIEYLYRRLEKEDPRSAARIHPRDHTRIIRALEVLELTGRAISSWREEKKQPRYRALYVVLNRKRPALYSRIDRRVDVMIQNGWVNEVERLRKEGVPDNAPGFRAVGYREILAFLDGKMTMEEAAKEIKKKSRHYARRQLIWFRKETDTFWIEREDEPDEAVAETVLEKIQKEENDDCEREPS